MKTKRLIALLLGALMLCMLIPVYAAGDNAAEELPVKEASEEPERKVFDEKGLMHADISVSNAANSVFTFFNYSSSAFAGYEGDGYNYVESTIAGQDSSSAVLSTEEFYMYSGETLVFWYWLESEKNYDLFKFSLTKDGAESTELTDSGASGGGTAGVWVKYTYTCNSNAMYRFTWKYVKDSSQSSGADCLRISGVQYSQHYMRYFLRAGLSQSGFTGDIMTFGRAGEPQYYFTVETSEDTGHELYLKSGNAGAHNTTSAIESNMYVPEAYLGDPVSKLYFDFKCSSETNYDKLKLLVDGETVWSISGSHNSWQSHEETISGAGVHTIRWEFVKDGSNNSGDDCACIDNIRITSELTGYDREYEYAWLNSSASDADLVFNTPSGYDSFRMVSDESGSTHWAACDNRFIDSSDAAIMTMVNMDAGETLSFGYWVSCERNYDRLEFYANGSEVARFFGWEHPEWTTYTYTAPSKGVYVFKWVYHKDSSNSYGFDLARIYNVKYKGSFHNSFTFEDALNANDSDVSFCFYTDYESSVGSFMPCYMPDGFSYAVSRNRCYESTKSIMGTSPIWMNPGDKMSFSYKVSAESYDKLKFTWTGPTSSQSGSETFSGQQDPQLTRRTFTCTYGGLYSFGWEFSKDVSINNYDDCAMISDVAVTRVELPTLDEAMNAQGSNLHFTNAEEGSSGFFPHYEGTTLCAGPENIGGFEGSEYSTATVFTTVYLDVGDMLCFDHNFNTDTSPVNADGEYVFSVNGMPVFNERESTSNGWQSYTYTAYTSGRYEFGWTYSRQPGAFYDGPIDFLSIKNVRIEDGGVTRPGLKQSLLGSETDIDFTSSNFVGDYYDGSACGTSITYGTPNSTAYVRTETLHLYKGTELYFSYFFDTEDIFDTFCFLVNGEIEFSESGSGDWNICRYAITESGDYTFEWRYQKDGSVNAGLDCIKLNGITLNYTPGGMLGDIDNNGTVDTTDALYALRFALGLIELDPTAMLRADVDMNGTVDTTDALYILRYSLGLIDEF